MAGLRNKLGAWSLAASALGVLGCGASQTRGMSQGDDTPAEVRGLKNAASFADIDDDRTRAIALFTEAGKVLMHARCVNCHPATERPLQTDAQRPHDPPVVRGSHGRGPVGMQCNTCHQTDNVELGGWSIPGDPNWHLAPATMSWEGKSLSEICAQIKNPVLNGGKDMEALVHHMAEDSLVGWAWSPGRGRTPPPGTHPIFGTLVRQWAAAGAHCPGGAPPLAAAP